MSNKRRASAAAGDAPKRAKVDDAGDDSLTTLKITGLSAVMNDEEFEKIASNYGPLRSAFVVTAKDADKKCLGYGFAKFVLQEDALGCIKSIKDAHPALSAGWAKRRQRRDDDGNTIPVVEKPAPVPQRLPPIEKDIFINKTIIVQGFPSQSDDIKKTLYKKVKKLLATLPSPATAHGDVTVTWSTTRAGETLANVVIPSPRQASLIATRLHNSILKANLITAAMKYEYTAVERKGKGKGGGRVLVRNLAFDVSQQDLRSVFAPFGPLHSIDIPTSLSAEPGSETQSRGFAFVWFLRQPDAEKAIKAINATRIYSGCAQDHVTSVVQSEGKKKDRLKLKEEEKSKGKRSERGRLVAVDWALSKDEWKKSEVNAAEPTALDPKSTKPSKESGSDSEEEEDSDSDLDPIAIDEDEEDDGESDSEDDDDDSDLEPILDQGSEDDEDENSESDTANTSEKTEGTTLFVRNITFEATEDDLYTLFKTFGAVKYARVVKDATTQRSRGTGFVCFYKESDAQKVLDLASTVSIHSQDSKDRTSLLTSDPSSSNAARFTLHGRVVGVSLAVTRGEADKLREDRDRKGGNKDRRNLYLMTEGAVFESSPVAKHLAAADLQARQESYDSRKRLLRTNPSLYVSRTRLAIRQLPLYVGDGILRRLASHAIRQFDQEVKQGSRKALTADEIAEPQDSLGSASPASKAPKSATSKKHVYVKQAKILRQADRVDPSTNALRSKGYGFLELHDHTQALKVVRWTNANREANVALEQWYKEELVTRIATLQKKQQKTEEEDSSLKKLKERLEQLPEIAKTSRSTKTVMAEFSIENAVTVKRRNEREVKEKTKRSGDIKEGRKSKLKSETRPKRIGKDTDNKKRIPKGRDDNKRSSKGRDTSNRAGKRSEKPKRSAKK